MARKTRGERIGEEIMGLSALVLFNLILLKRGRRKLANACCASLASARLFVSSFDSATTLSRSAAVFASVMITSIVVRSTSLPLSHASAAW
jgi:preprotein translocase subunit SecG